MLSAQPLSALPFTAALVVMACVTYAVRMIPLVMCKKKIRSRFLRSFLRYIPYAVLGAMTFPAVFFSTGSPVSAAAGCAAALLLGFSGKSLLSVAGAACAVVFAIEIFFLLC